MPRIMRKDVGAEDTAMAVALWMFTQTTRPELADVCAQFGCTRPEARRWLDRYLAAASNHAWGKRYWVAIDHGVVVHALEDCDHMTTIAHVAAFYDLMKLRGYEVERRLFANDRLPVTASHVQSARTSERQTGMRHAVALANNPANQVAA